MTQIEAKHEELAHATGAVASAAREALTEPVDPTPLTPRRSLLHRLTPLISITLFVAAGVLIWREMRAHSVREVLEALSNVPARRIFYAFLLTIAGYIGLIFYDYLAFLYVRHPLPLRRIAMGSFIAYGFSNALGHPVFTGGSLRYRVYSAWGVSAGEAATIIIFCLLSFKIGMIALCGAVMLYEPGEVMHLTKLPYWSVTTIGVGLLMFGLTYLLWTVVRTRPLRIRKFEVRLPSLSLAVGQILTAWVDMAFAGGVLYVLLPHDPDLNFLAFWALFLIAIIAGNLSMVPAGLGIFEWTMLKLLTPVYEDQYPNFQPMLLGLLLAYRAIYFLLPLIAAAALLGWHEYKQGVGKGAVVKPST